MSKPTKIQPVTKEQMIERLRAMGVQVIDRDTDQDALTYAAHKESQRSVLAMIESANSIGDVLASRCRRLLYELEELGKAVHPEFRLSNPNRFHSWEPDYLLARQLLEHMKESIRKDLGGK